MNKIVFFMNNLSGGGAERVMSIISNRLANNYDIIVYSLKHTENIYGINSKVKIKYLYNYGELDKKIKRIRKIRKVIKSEKPDIIISFEYFVNISVIISNFFLRNTLIISERNDPHSEGNNVKNIRNFLYRFCNLLVCQTPDSKSYFPKYIQKKTIIIPNPVKKDLPERYIGKRNKEIVNFCRFSKQKNLPLLIDAFEKVRKKYKDYKLVLYGDGILKKQIENYIKEKKLTDSIVLKPFDKEVHNKILKSAMFVSSSDYEGISNSMLEAMAIGLPTICTDCPCGGARMIINNGINGILVNVGDKEELSKKIILLIENKEIANKISLNGIKVRDDYSEEKISQLWINAIEEFDRYNK